MAQNHELKDESALVVSNAALSIDFQDSGGNKSIHDDEPLR
jgi:hypothetical protein